ncbi:MarR family transcriptional regulator [Halomontanus rarus]|uniref:MarR family transcriptional regulator n=1 Tax=Halomontanus rarus TaxID=3034020 RepID=UPI0023E8E421|nr:MarR family transcriptional regulator [Halovivax sp. TS33]
MNEFNRLKEMVERVSWFSPVHYEILEFFEKHDIWISARGLAKNIDYDRNYVSRECPTLVENGILQKEGTIYSLTDQGRAFLAGELNADDLEADSGA